MGRGPTAIRKLPEHLKAQLLYYVAELAVEKKKSRTKIAEMMERWVEKNAPDYYNEDGKVDPATAGSYLKEAIEKGFVKLTPFYDYDKNIVEEIKKKLESKEGLSLKDINIYVAPHRDRMLHYVWADLDRLLTKMISEEKRDEVIVGVSGGHTLLDFAKGRDPAELEWFNEVPKKEREKVIVCSLTSGGIRTDIAALSDMVAADIADYLGTRVHGLLGPAWFASKEALKAFSGDQDVVDHKDLIEKADIILTSVGYFGDPNSLMRQLLKQLLGEEGEADFIEAHKNENVSDILYHCYNGLTGDDIKLPDEVADGLFSVIDIKQLSKRVEQGTRCIVVASGEAKAHCIVGILKRKISRHIYLDCACAKSLSEII